MAASVEATVQRKASADERRNAAPVRDTLLTVVLVLYPAVGVLSVIAAGVIFSNAGV